MGLLKSLFVEEIPNKEKQFEEMVSVETLGVEAELESVNTDTLINDIYAENNLYDKAKSIFKVEELINSLPKEMVTETKKTSVLAILGNFGVTVTDVSLDGESRIDVLRNILSKIISNGKGNVSEKESEIEDHKREIERLEKEISDKQHEVKISEATINAEVLRLSELVKFVGGAE